MAFMCDNCGKEYGMASLILTKGVAGGQWKKRAQSTRKVFKPNLHKWQGMKLCTKCLRRLKTKNTPTKP